MEKVREGPGWLQWRYLIVAYILVPLLMSGKRSSLGRGILRDANRLKLLLGRLRDVGCLLFLNTTVRQGFTATLHRCLQPGPAEPAVESQQGPRTHVMAFIEENSTMVRSESGSSFDEEGASPGRSIVNTTRCFVLFC